LEKKFESKLYSHATLAVVDTEVRDSMDRVTAGWAERRPDLPVWPLHVLGRMERLVRVTEPIMGRVFARHGISDPTFAVLATLVRLGGSPAPQHRLLRELNLTSGTLSVRIDRLEAAGLVRRSPDPGDGRGTLVQLTEAGRASFEACAVDELGEQERLLAALSPPEVERLAGLLRKLLVSIEGPDSDAPIAARLGATLAPAHVALRRRAGVGLPARIGLLVEHVVAGGVAACAGLRPGDLLVAAGGVPLRALEDLAAALSRHRGGTVELGIVRGAEQLAVAVRLRGDGATPPPPG
jgi:DNA-binding MarR family transcriptional regulator